MWYPDAKEGMYHNAPYPFYSMNLLIKVTSVTSKREYKAHSIGLDVIFVLYFF